MALKASVAAAIAWYVGVLAPAPLSDYPYYAPLGAVIATSTTVARSVRETAQTTGAILLGVVVARLADAFLAPGALSIALVVALATVAAGWGRLGDMGAYVTTTALFVLVIGSSDPGSFVGAYAGLVVAGALVGIGVSFLFPPLPLSPSDVALDGLRDTLADQLDALADGLRGERPPTSEEWDERRFALRPVLEKSRAAVAYAGEASRGNWHARRYSAWSVAQARRSELLERHATLVDQVTSLVAEGETHGTHEPALGPDLRPLTADALAAYARALRAEARGGYASVHAGRSEARQPERAAPTDGDPRSDATAHEEAAQEEAPQEEAGDEQESPAATLAEAVDALRGAVREQRSRREADFLTAGALVLSLDRASLTFDRTDGGGAESDDSDVSDDADEDGDGDDRSSS